MIPGYRSHYEVLNIEITASADDVKHAFRLLSKIHHPDKKGSPDSTALFSLILNAYQVLCDPKSRNEYDHFLMLSGYIRNQSGRNRSLQIHSDRDIFTNSLASLLNMALWEVEELISRRTFLDRMLGELSVKQYILTILTFLDKWILIPRGYKDFFMESRKLPELDPRLYIQLLGSVQKEEIRLPYTGVTDYFYDIRKRANRFISDIKNREGSEFLWDEALGQDVKEFHNLTVHYLSYLLKESPEDLSPIPAFPFSNDKYRFPG